MKQPVKRRLTPSVTKDAQIGIRVKAELRAALEELARRERRPLSHYIEIVLEDHVAAQKRR